MFTQLNGCDQKAILGISCYFIFIPYSVGTISIRQNLTYVDVRF